MMHFSYPEQPFHRAKQYSEKFQDLARRHVIKPIDIAGLHYVVRIFVGSWLAWLVAERMGEISPLWAVVSLIAVTEPQMKPALRSFFSRAVNTVIGCIVGLSFLLLFGVHPVLLPIAAGFAAFLSVHVLSMQQGWRVGPVTAVLVMSAGLIEHSTHGAVHLAIERALGVLTGSFIALFVTWVMSMIWMPAESVAPETAEQKKEPMA